MVTRIGWAAGLAAVGLALGGCADRYGYGGGLGYEGSYYSDYGPAGYYEPYGYGGGFGYGWYGDFYYPGSGVYVYDRYRRPYRWNDGQRRYWQSRPGFGHSPSGDGWRGFDHRPGGAPGGFAGRDGRTFGEAHPQGQAFGNAPGGFRGGADGFRSGGGGFRGAGGGFRSGGGGGGPRGGGGHHGSR